MTRRTSRRCFFLKAEDGIRDKLVTGVQTCALPIFVGQPLDEQTAAAAGEAAVRGARPMSGNLYKVQIAKTAVKDRKSVVEGKSVDLGGRRIIKKKIHNFY